MNRRKNSKRRKNKLKSSQNQTKKTFRNPPPSAQKDSNFLQPKSIMFHLWKDHRHLVLALIFFITVLSITTICFVAYTRPANAAIATVLTSQGHNDLARQPATAAPTPKEDQLSSEAKETYSTYLTGEDRQTIYHGLSINVIWVLILTSVVAFWGVYLVYKAPASRSTLLLNGGATALLGALEIWVFYVFDAVAMLTLTGDSAGLMQKQIALIAGIVGLIQVALGINIFTQGLTLNVTKEKTAEEAREIELLRKELQALRYLLENWSQAQNQCTSKQIFKTDK